ncbi:MAG: rRNA maturation RNase YbeY [Vicinamibacterales bacterium]|jgi:probable rRNA maturation factor|nr:rRNA maturation RNase YbeY [Acidobacteriota bacterium]MDP6372990.1 rRNA maturation RNase YbeY [Vicinamibacterales bacterium]MDP6607853.1 rRNA maturation RNase YbeY [Vicinamibacterales bacterium]HAK56142.1 rRNA maturation RNase YbeY [Acidobacteriota bacterium]
MPSVHRSDSRAGLRVAVTDDLGRGLRHPGLTRWLRLAAPSSAQGLVTVALVTDARIRSLNRRFRGVDRVTDVLSFPMDDRADGPETPPAAGSAGRHLGDVVIGLGRADRQARSAGHPPATELKILALHGLLHLLGYDHAGDDGRMARVEQECLRRGGLAAGLIARAGGASRDR